MSQGSIFYAAVDDHYVIKFIGEVRLTLCTSLDSHIEQILSTQQCQNILIDLTEATCLDSTTLGLIAKFAIRAKQNAFPTPVLVTTHEDITRMVMTMGFDKIFVVLNELPETLCELQQVPVVQESVEAVQERIINAHKLLMSLSQSNYDAFKSLVSVLEKK
jgi:anti-anti-sigma factor